MTFFSFFNNLALNISLLVSSLLLLSTGHIWLALSSQHRPKLQKRGHALHFYERPRFSAFLQGTFIGIAGFFLSYNRMVIQGDITLDFRYFLIFFVVYYSSVQIGTIATIVLISLKFIQYFLMTDPNWYLALNNIFTTIAILVLSILLLHHQVTIQKASYFVLFTFAVLRLILFLLIPNFLVEYWDLVTLYFVILILCFTFISFIILRIMQLRDRVDLVSTDSLRDSLTTLYNRKAYDQTLANCLEQKESFSLAVMDVNDFKGINDEFGHRVGDLTLEKLAYFLRKEFLDETSETDIFRIGGDEFAIISLQSAASISKKLENVNRELLLVSGQQDFPKELILQIAYGCLDNQPEHFMQPHDLYVATDQQLYANKAKLRMEKERTKKPSL